MRTSTLLGRYTTVVLLVLVWGMVASVALYRLYFRVRPMIALNFSRRSAGVL